MSLGTSAVSATKGLLSGAGKGMSDVGLGSLKQAGMTALSNPALVFAAVQGISDVNRQMDNGNGFGTSVFKAGVSSLLYANNPVLMTALDLAPLAYQGAQAAGAFRRTKGDELAQRKRDSYGRLGGGYLDTMQAQTMRQAAVQQIQGNKLNARSALGGEARIFANNIY